jgi:hypothetical protein
VPKYETVSSDISSTIFNYYDFRSFSIDAKVKFGKELRTARRKTGVTGNERIRM